MAKMNGIFTSGTLVLLSFTSAEEKPTSESSKNRHWTSAIIWWSYIIDFMVETSSENPAFDKRFMLFCVSDVCLSFAGFGLIKLDLKTRSENGLVSRQWISSHRHNQQRRRDFWSHVDIFHSQWDRHSWNAFKMI